MNDPSIREASLSDIHRIQQLAEKTWWPTYSVILAAEQIQYMLDTIYSEASLKKVMENGSQTFILLEDERGSQGFAAYGKRKEQPSVFKLHKIYVLPDNQGKGYGRKLIQEVCKRIQQEGANCLDLNVNRHNPAKQFYERIGFRVIREEDIPIGPYWMNDYVMRLERGTGCWLMNT
jgi:ribosomal protein S18 acetylase RimI-like enzyme